MKTAAISGLTGYIGKSFGEHLSRLGWTIVPITRGVSITELTELFQKEKPEVVFHFASFWVAEHEPNDVHNLIHSNILFGTQIAESMRLTGVRKLVNAGTGWQHYREEAYNPVCLYSATKTAFEDILEYFVRAESFQVINLEIFDTYGPNDPRPKLIPKLLKSKGGFEISAGEQKLHFVHISDIVRAFDLAMQMLLKNTDVKGSMASYSLPSSEALPLREIIHMVEKLTHESLRVQWGTRPYRRREVMKPWTPNPPLTGWRAEIDLLTGLRSLIDDKN